MTEIRIAKDYSRYPGGRYRRLGKYSGEEFRDDFLRPALEQGCEVKVVLDGTEGYGSSFLEEAFGGLIRAGCDPNVVRAKLKPIAEDAEFETYVDEIWQYIDDAVERTSDT